ncbi:MAG: hypothetical protein KF812_00605 [Fimbriimonadaceae bacterium]|nr:hypothetical protein [Fimbriimonadaceae bacterium]
MRWLALIGVAVGSVALAQNDAAYGAKIKEYTTETFFLTEMVDHLPASRTVPTPLQHFGEIIGAPNVLHHTADFYAYYQKLDAASQRVIVRKIGTSEDGRDMIVAIISDEANLARLDRVKEINGILGDPRRLSSAAMLAGADEKAEPLIKEGLPIYYATAGMHCTEAGPPEMLMELAYRLAVSEEPMIQDIRRNSVVMLTPTLDPDGRDRYVDTYMYRKQNPEKPAIPLVYWGNYVAHDSNRDNMGMSLALSKYLMQTWLEFKPTVLHDLHESVPYLYISTGTGPYNAWLDPITIDEWHMMAYEEVNQMTRRGVPGVWTHDFYDGWAPNYAFYIANGHNAIGRFYETFGAGADSGIRTVGSQSQRAWYRPNPPFPSVRWSLRNNTNLMQSGILLGMHNLAENREKFLRNYYLKSKRSILKAQAEGPAAYVLSAKPGREWNLSEMRTLMNRQGVEVANLNSDFEFNGEMLKAGSLVIRMDQPYSRMADMLLDKQYYRADDPRPYDDTGWTLGPLFDIKSVRVTDAKILAHTSAGEPARWMEAAKIPQPRRSPVRTALVHTWQSTQDEGWFRLAFESAGVPYEYISVHDLRDTVRLRDRFDVIVLSPTRGSAQSIVNGVSKEGEPIPWKPLPGFPHLGGVDQTDNIRGGIELQGMLNIQRFVEEGGLLICVAGTCAIPIEYGIVSGVSIAEPTELFAPGGVFRTDNVARNSPVTKTFDEEVGVYFSTGPLLNVGGGGFGGRGGGGTTGRPTGRGDDNDADVVQGRPPYTPRREPSDQAPTVNQQPTVRPEVLLRFSDLENLLISGALDHGDELEGKAALVRCPVGKGNVLLFAINPMWRHTTIGSWPLVFNAVWNWDNLASPEPEN